MSKLIPATALSYDEGQIRHGLERADNQCELHAKNGTRCTEEAVSYVPFLVWVNGGEPPMDNFVAACDEHALQYKKGLSFLRSIRVVKSRASYFPEGERVGPAVFAAALLSTT